MPTGAAEGELEAAAAVAGELAGSATGGGEVTFCDGGVEGADGGVATAGEEEVLLPVACAEFGVILWEGDTCTPPHMSAL